MVYEADIFSNRTKMKGDDTIIYKIWHEKDSDYIFQ